MDLLMILPPIVSTVGILGALTMQAVAQCLLTMLEAALVAGVGVFVVAAVAWWSLKKALARLTASSGDPIAPLGSTSR
jgi:hypothetical protein